MKLLSHILIILLPLIVLNGCHKKPINWSVNGSVIAVTGPNGVIMMCPNGTPEEPKGCKLEDGHNLDELMGIIVKQMLRKPSKPAVINSPEEKNDTI